MTITNHKSRIRVAIIGASGVTGDSIVNALLAHPDGQFNVAALVRPGSLGNPAYGYLRQRGVEIIPADLGGPLNQLISVLSGIDVVISAIFYGSLDFEIPLATAAKAAGVGRFIQSAYNIPVPAKGVYYIREKKEEILSHIQQLRLPYTYIDVGWWYHVVLPRIPSGRTEHALPCGSMDLPIADLGNVPSCLTHIRDVGRYIARIITDQRTLNKKVFVYNEALTQNQVYEIIECVSDERPKRTYISEKDIRIWREEAQREVQKNSSDVVALGQLCLRDVFLASNVNGYNTPEYAEYLGYLSGKELYPDFEYLTYEDYVQEVLEGKHGEDVVTYRTKQLK
ncbi:NAD(P)-binding protein [Aspergillus insuetus]